MQLYDYHLIYNDSVNDNLICSICCQPFIEPVASPCKHYFCRQCIEKALDIKAECPIDRLSLNLMDTVLAPTIVTNMVNELKVKCPNSDKGCEYISQRHLILGHLEECSLRNLESFEEESILVDDGHNLCPHCQTPNNNLISHIIICEEMLITCRCNRFGCSWTGPRKQLDEHSQDCNYLKIELFLEKQESRIIALEKENSELRSLVLSFHNDLEAMTEKIGDSTAHSQGTSDSDSSRAQNQLSNTSRFFNDLPAASLERVRADHQRLRFELMSLSSSLISLEQKQNITLSVECNNLREEIQVLRHSLQSLKADFDDTNRERQSTLSALAALAKTASSRVSRSSFNSQDIPLKKNDYKL